MRPTLLAIRLFFFISPGCLLAQWGITTGGPTGVVIYKRDISSGELMLPGTPVPAGITPTQTVMDPTDSFFYALDPATKSIYAFAFNDATGDLTPLPAGPYSQGSPFKLPGDPVSMTMSDDGETVTVFDADGAVSVYRISRGRLRPGEVAGSLNLILGPVQVTPQKIASIAYAPPPTVATFMR